MHFREVSKQLNQLKTNVYWASESLNSSGWQDIHYQACLRNYEEAQQALTEFLNTPVSQLG